MLPFMPSWIMAPFGATCVILFAAPQSPLAQPRNVIVGHLLTAGVGLAMLYGVGNESWMIALAVGLAIMLMQVCRAVHPPAGASRTRLRNRSSTRYPRQLSLVIVDVL